MAKPLLVNSINTVISVHLSPICILYKANDKRPVQKHKSDYTYILICK